MVFRRSLVSISCRIVLVVLVWYGGRVGLWCCLFLVFFCVFWLVVGCSLVCRSYELGDVLYVVGVHPGDQFLVYFCKYVKFSVVDAYAYLDGAGACHEVFDEVFCGGDASDSDDGDVSVFGDVVDAAYADGFYSFS